MIHENYLLRQTAAHSIAKPVFRYICARFGCRRMNSIVVSAGALMAAAITAPDRHLPQNLLLHRICDSPFRALINHWGLSAFA
jgi:hypothetical protein